MSRNQIFEKNRISCNRDKQIKMKFEQDFLHYIKSGATIIQIISHETQRIHGVVNKTADELERSWFSWNRIEGIKKWEQGEFIDEDADCREASCVLEKFEEEDFENSLLILEDFHPDLTENQPHIIRRLRNIAQRKYDYKALILAQPITGLPVELEKEIQVTPDGSIYYWKYFKDRMELWRILPQ